MAAIRACRFHSGTAGACCAIAGSAAVHNRARTTAMPRGNGLAYLLDGMVESVLEIHDRPARAPFAICRQSTTIVPAASFSRFPRALSHGGASHCLLYT